MIILGFFIISSMAAVFIANLHNALGAIILGLDAAGTDFFLLWLRFKYTNPNKNKYLALMVFGGLLIRAAFLFIFIRIGLWWFGSDKTEFYIFMAAILTMPIWNIIAAYQFKAKRE